MKGAQFFHVAQGWDHLVIPLRQSHVQCWQWGMWHSLEGCRQLNYLHRHGAWYGVGSSNRETTPTSGVGVGVVNEDYFTLIIDASSSWVLQSYRGMATSTNKLQSVVLYLAMYVSICWHSPSCKHMCISQQTPIAHMKDFLHHGPWSRPVTSDIQSMLTLYGCISMVVLRREEECFKSFWAFG